MYAYTYRDIYRERLKYKLNLIRKAVKELN